MQAHWDEVLTQSTNEADEEILGSTSREEGFPFAGLYIVFDSFPSPRWCEAETLSRPVERPASRVENEEGAVLAPCICVRNGSAIAWVK